MYAFSVMGDRCPHAYQSPYSYYHYPETQDIVYPGPRDMGVSNVPAFLTKLWTLVEDPSTDDLICWDSSGVSFHLYDQGRFAKEILPLYFKHSNIASFIRQLNMYGFRKVIHMESGAIKSEWDDVEFHHPYFVRGEEELLVNIKRKQSSTATVKADPGVRLNHDDINRVLTDVQGMKQQQETFTSKLENMKRENEALWREVASLRQKHLKQQQIVNKLIEFMIHLVGGKKGLKTGLPLKRKMPLMISDKEQVATPKRQKYGKSGFSIEEVTPSYVVNSPESATTMFGESNSLLSSGPEIHDVTDLLLASTSQPSLTSAPSPLHIQANSPRSSSVSSMDNISTNLRASPVSRKSPAPVAGTSPAPTSRPGSVLAPVSILSPNATQKSKAENSQFSLDASLDTNDLSSLVDLNFFQNMEPSTSTSHGYDMSLDKYNRHLKEGGTLTLPTEMNTQIDSMQDQLDDLKDLLSGTQYQFDPTTLLGLFNNETTLPSVPSSLEHAYSTDFEKKLVEDNKANQTNNIDPNTIVGNELVSFPLDSSLPTTYPDLSDLMSPPDHNAVKGLLPSLQAEVDNYEPVEIDPMSFVNLPGTVQSQDDSSKIDQQKK